MHHTLVRSIVLSSLLLAPSLARAEVPTTLAPAAPEPPVATSRVAPASVELTLGVRPYLGIGGVDSNALGFVLAPSADVAVAPDPRVLLVLGAEFQARDTEAYGSYGSLWIPLLVHVYLDTPRVGAIVPSIRAGVLGSFSWYEEGDGYSGALRVEAGVTWLADPALALRLEVGGSLNATYSELERSVGLSGSLGGRASVVLRM